LTETNMKKNPSRKKATAKKPAPRKDSAKRRGRRPTRPAARRQTGTPTLYERLGSVYSIAAVVDDFIDRLMDDARLNANPKVDEAHHRVSRAGFKYLVTEQVCWAAGGPQTYTGRSMRDSHGHLAITPAEWDAFLDDLRQTLDAFGVRERERQELFAIVNSTRGDIVVGK
jgi:hemoglobin